MRAGGREWLVVSSAALGLMIGACLDSGDTDNDRGYSAVDGGLPGGPTGGATTGGATTGGATTGGATTGGATTGGATTGGATTGGATTGGATTGGATTGGATTGGATTGGGAMPGGGAPVNFAGKATGCLSYTMPMGDKCSGFYCNVTVPDIMSHFPLTGKCTAFSAAQICTGALPTHTGECAQEQSGASEGNRATMLSCIKGKGDYAAATDDCLNCFVNAAICASDNCLLDCLINGTASEPCETCRNANNCNKPVPACAGLPNPFPP